MTPEQVIKFLEELKENYLYLANKKREHLQKNMADMTAQQIAIETIYIQDMESRAYGLTSSIENFKEFCDE